MIKIVESNNSNIPQILNDLELKDLFSNTNLYLIFDNEKLLGAYQLQEYPSGIEIRYGVLKEERQKGYGEFILNLAYEKACEKYSNIDAVLYITENNRSSYKVAEKCGFTLDESMDYEETCMRKFIPSKKRLQK